LNDFLFLIAPSSVSEFPSIPSIDSTHRPFSVDLSLGNKEFRRGEIGGYDTTVVSFLARNSRIDTMREPVHCHGEASIFFPP
jgi:hypothetical protein